MQHFDLHGVHFGEEREREREGREGLSFRVGSRAAAVNMEVRGEGASMLNRKCVMVRWVGLTPDRFLDLVHKGAGAILILIPQDWKEKGMETANEVGNMTNKKAAEKKLDKPEEEEEEKVLDEEENEDEEGREKVVEEEEEEEDEEEEGVKAISVSDSHAESYMHVKRCSPSVGDCGGEAAGIRSVCTGLLCCGDSRADGDLQQDGY